MKNVIRLTLNADEIDACCVAMHSLANAVFDSGKSTFAVVNNLTKLSVARAPYIESGATIVDSVGGVEKANADPEALKRFSEMRAVTTDVELRPISLNEHEVARNQLTAAQLMLLVKHEIVLLVEPQVPATAHVIPMPSRVSTQNAEQA